MKTLSKIRINDDNILGEEELKNLKGGWSGYCWIYCGPVILQGYGEGTSQEAAEKILSTTYAWCQPDLSILCIAL
jgi:hypothetical protein